LLVKPSIFIHKAFVAYQLYIFHKCLLKLSHIGSELQFLVYNFMNNIKLRTTGSFLRIYAISLPRSSDTSPFMSVFLVKFCRKSIPFFWRYALFRKHIPALDHKIPNNPMKCGRVKPLVFYQPDKV